MDMKKHTNIYETLVIILEKSQLLYENLNNLIWWCGKYNFEYCRKLDLKW